MRAMETVVVAVVLGREPKFRAEEQQLSARLFIGRVPVM